MSRNRRLAAGIPLDDFIQKCLGLGGKGGDGIDSLEAFKNSLNEGWLTGDIVAKAIDAFIGPIEKVGDVAEGATAGFERFKEIINEVIQGKWSTGEERMRKFTEAGWDAAAMQEAVNKVWYGGELSLEDYEAALISATDEELKAAGYTDEQIENLRELQKQYAELEGSIDDTAASTVGLKTGSELLFDGISKGWNAIKGIFSAMKAGWDIAFPPMTPERLYDILDAFNAITNKFNDWVGNFDNSDGSALDKTVVDIRDTFGGLASVGGIAIDALKDVITFLKDTFGEELGAAADKVLNFTGTVGRFIINLRQWMKDNNIIGRGLGYLKKRIDEIVAGFKTWYASFKELPWVQSRLEKLNTWFGKIGDTITKIFPKSSKAVKELWNRVKVFFKRSGQGGFEAIVNYVKSLGTALKSDLIEKWNALKSSNFFGGFVTGLEDIWKAIKTLDPKVLPDWASKTWEGIKKFFKPITDFFADIKKRLTNAAGDVGDGFDAIGNTIVNAAKYLKDHIGTIIAAFGLFILSKTVWNFVSAIASIAKAITAPVTTIVNAISAFQSAATGLARAATGFAMVEVVGSIIALALTAAELGKVPEGQLVRGVGVVFALTGMVAIIIALLTRFREAGSMLKPKSFSDKIAGMFKVVELAAAMMLVGIAFQKFLEVVKVATLKQIGEAFGLMVAVIIVLGALTGVLSKLGGTGGSGMTGPLLGIAALVYVLSEVFQDIFELVQNSTDSSKIDQAKTILLDMFGAVAVIAIALAAINKLPSSGGTGKIGGSILAVAVAVKILVGVIDDISNLDLSTWDSGKTGVLVGIIVALGVIMMALSLMPKKAGMNGVGLFAVAASVEVLAIAIRTMASLDGEDIAKGVTAIGAMILFLGLFTVLTSKGSNLTGKSAVVFLGLSAAILILSGAIALLSLLDAEDVAIGVLAITAMITAIGVMMFLSSIASDLKVGHFVGLSIVIGVLAASIAVFSLLDPADVFVGTVALTALITACGVMMLLTSAAKGITAAPFVGLIIVIGTLAGAIALLSKMDPVGVIVAASALSEVIVVCGIMMALSRIAKGLDVGPFAGLALVVAAIAISIGALALLPADGLQAAASALESVMVVFSIMSVVLGLVCRTMSKDIDDAMPALAALVIVLAGVGTVIAILSNNIQHPLIAVAICEALSFLFLSMGGTLKAVAALGKLSFKEMGVGIVGLIGILGIMGGLLVLLGSLFSEDQIADINDRMQRAVPLFQSIGSAIGGVINGLLTSLFSVDLSGLFDQLSQFGAGVKQMAADLSGITFSEGAASAIKSVGAALLYLAGADILNAITSLFGGETSSFATAFDGLAEFGTELKAFGDNLEGVNAENIQAGASAAEALSKFQGKLPRSGGLIQKLIGEPADITSFGEQMVEFGKSIIAASAEDSFGGVTSDDCEKIKNGAAAAQAVSDLQGKLPASGGLVQKVIGEKESLTKFGAEMAAFGAAVMVASSDAGFGGVTEDDCTKIKNAADAATAVVAVQNALPEGDGLIQKIIGEPGDLSEFGKDMAALADAVYVAVKGTTVDGVKKHGFGDLTETELSSIENAATYVQKIVELQGQLGEDSGILGNLFGGQTSISTFGQRLVDFASALVDFTGSEKGLGAVSDWSLIETAVTKVEKIIGLSTNHDLSTVSGELSSAADAIADIGNAFGNGKGATDGFYDAVKDVNTEKVGSVITELSNLISAMNDISASTTTNATSFSTALGSLASAGIGDFCTAFDDAHTQAETAVTDFLTASTSAISDSLDVFGAKGSEYASAFIDGFNSSEQKSKAISAMTELSGIITETLFDSTSDFKDAGEEAITKYLKEFQNPFDSAESAGREFVERVLSGVSREADQFRKEGETAVSRYTSAMTSLAVSAQSAGLALSNNAIIGLSKNTDAARVYGNNFSQAFILGMQGYAKSTYNAAYNIGRSAVNGLKRGIDAHSPSREAAKSADNFGIGFTSGLLSWLAKVGSASEDLGNKAVERLRKVMTKLPDMFSGEINLDPVIRPQVDLSSARQSVQTLNGMFNKSVGVVAEVASVTGSTVAASKVRTVSADSAQTAGESQTMTSPLTIQNTFNITSNDPEEVANTVSRRIQRQVERKEATWAQLSGMRSPLVRSR